MRVLLGVCLREEWGLWWVKGSIEHISVEASYLQRLPSYADNPSL